MDATITNKTTIDELLIKQPFKRITPYNYRLHQQEITDAQITHTPNQQAHYTTITQADFLMELEPTGHRINDPEYYPNKTKIDDETKKVTIEQVSRVSFPFQSIITTKQLVHLCGNNIQFSIASPTINQQDYQKLNTFKQGWIDKNMEEAFYQCAKSEKTTGDTALCLYYHEGKVKWKAFSYATGDTLYPHYDQQTGELSQLIRQYKSYDQNDKEIKTYLEHWDNKYLTRYQKDNRQQIKNKIKGAFGISQYTQTEKKTHGFSRIPIAYKRAENGACWTNSQSNIEMYEMAVSQLCENNKAYAFPILFLKGGDLAIRGSITGKPYAIISDDNNSDAKMLSRADASTSFELQLKILLQNIFLGSFTVLPPEVKSGDLPGVAIKLIYSPAVEKAMEDAKQWYKFIDDTTTLFKEGYANEIKQHSHYKDFKISAEIKPYVHQNTAELINNLYQGVISGYISKKTASEVAPYTKTDEYKRLLDETRDEILGLTTQQDNTTNPQEENK